MAKLKIVNSVKLIEKEFKIIPLQGVMSNVFGDLTEDAKVFVSGPPKRGKSTFILAFVHHLADIGYKVLYIAGEETDGEGLKYSVLRRIKNGKKAHKNIDLVDQEVTASTLLTEDKPAEKWDVIVFDSIQSVEVNDETYHEIVDAYPKKLLIFISQVNNKGKNNHRKIEHDVDVVCDVKDGTVHVASRFSDQPRTVQVFDRKGRQIQLNFNQDAE